MRRAANENLVEPDHEAIRGNEQDGQHGNHDRRQKQETAEFLAFAKSVVGACIWIWHRMAQRREYREGPCFL